VQDDGGKRRTVAIIATFENGRLILRYAQDDKVEDGSA
jgi:hypothetical protein